MRVTSLIFYAATVALAASSVAGGEPRAARESTAQRAEKADKKAEAAPVFACSLTALDATQRARHKELTGRLRQAVTGLRELGSGYAFSFAADSATILEVAEWVTLERLCCPFFTFRLEFGSEGKPASLEMTGPEGVKEFMRVEFNIKQ
jgi:hypothetical protein